MKHTRFMHRLKRRIPTKEQIYDFVFDDASLKEVVTSMGTVALLSLPGFYIAYEIAKPLYFGGTVEYKYYRPKLNSQQKLRKSEAQRKEWKAKNKKFEHYIEQLDQQIATGTVTKEKILEVPDSLTYLLPREPYTYSVDALHSSLKRTENKTYSMYQYQALLQGYKYFDHIKQRQFGKARKLYNNKKLTQHMPFETSDRMREAQGVIKNLTSMYKEYKKKNYLKAKSSLYFAGRELKESKLLDIYTSPFQQYIASVKKQVYHKAKAKATAQDDAIYQIYRIIDSTTPPTQKDFNALHEYVTVVPSTYLGPHDYYHDIQEYLKKHNLKRTLQLCASKRFDEYYKTQDYKNAIDSGFKLLHTYHVGLPLSVSQAYNLSEFDGYTKAQQLVNSLHKKKFHVKLGKALYKEAKAVYRKYNSHKRLSTNELQYVANLLEVAHTCYNKFSTLTKSQERIEKNLRNINIRLLARYVEERQMDDSVLKTYNIVQTQKANITSTKNKKYVSSLLNKFNNVYALTYVTK